MRPIRLLVAAVAASLAALAADCAHATPPDPNPKPASTERHEHEATLGIPASVRTEHEAIHAALVEATRAPGRVGAAAKDLARVLHPHFVREEEIALPPLGLLAPLAAGERPAEAMKSMLAKSDSLRAELPGMLQEHVGIRTAVAALRAAALEEKDAKAERLADDLTLHARTEEEVLYPAAILVGTVIRSLSREK